MNDGEFHYFVIGILLIMFNALFIIFNHHNLAVFVSYLLGIWLFGAIVGLALKLWRRDKNAC